MVVQLEGHAGCPRAFADHGVVAVSLAQGVRERGHRHASAIQYYVGTRDDLLVAILTPHVHAIARRRRELLDRAEQQPDDDLRSVVEALVRPVTELALLGWRERAYLRIGLDVNAHADRVGAEVTALITQTASRPAFSLLRRRLPPLPRAVWSLRRAACVTFVAQAAADRARAIEADPVAARDDLDDDAFVAALVDMYLGVFTAPVTAPVTAPTRGGGPNDTNQAYLSPHLG